MCSNVKLMFMMYLKNYETSNFHQLILKPIHIILQFCFDML